MNGRKAASPDDILERVLKTCADKLALVLTTIFNLSLTQSIVLLCFKIEVPKLQAHMCYVALSEFLTGS